LHHPQFRARRLPCNAPPSTALRANPICGLIALRACNQMVAIKVLDLRDDCPGWRVKTRMTNSSSCPSD
jgi:hypothetical protein